jgi:hypothetical protein
MALAISEQRYQRGDASAAQLQEVIDEVLEQLTVPDSEAAHAARAADLQPVQLSGVRIEVREAEQGAEPVLTTIAVGIAVAAGSKIAGTLWDEVIWPRLRRRLGARALGARTVASGTTGTSRT